MPLASADRRLAAVGVAVASGSVWAPAARLSAVGARGPVALGRRAWRRMRSWPLGVHLTPATRRSSSPRIMGLRLNPQANLSSQHDFDPLLRGVLSGMVG